MNLSAIRPFFSSQLMINSKLIHRKIVEKKLILILLYILSNKMDLVNSVDPDKTPQNAASKLGLRCLH